MILITNGSFYHC